MATQKIRAKQVPSIGETPAEARKRMASSAPKAASTPKTGLQEPADRMEAARAEVEGFSATGGDSPTIENSPEAIESLSPGKAATMVRQLSQEKLQLQTELEAALNLVGRYKAEYGEMD